MDTNTTAPAVTILPVAMAGAATVHLTGTLDTFRAGSRQLFLDPYTLCGKRTNRLVVARGRAATCKACCAAHVQQLEPAVAALEAEALAEPATPAHLLEQIAQGYSCSCGAMFVDSRARLRALDHLGLNAPAPVESEELTAAHTQLAAARQTFTEARDALHQARAEDRDGSVAAWLHCSTARSALEHWERVVQLTLEAEAMAAGDPYAGAITLEPAPAAPSE